MEDHGAATVPPAVEAAWGLRERPGKGARPGLSAERVVAAGIAVAAAGGLGAVSMGKVAGELGVSAMALYRYVGSKDELLVLMEDAAYGPPPAAPEGDVGWRDLVTAWARGQREVLHRNLWLVRMPVGTPPLTPNSVAWLEQGLRALAGTGFEEGEKLRTLMLVNGFVRMEAGARADLAATARAAGRTLEEAAVGQGRLLARLADPGRFPAVGRALASRALADAGEPEADFAFGLGRVLDGIEALVRERAHG
ncbi:MULTISPECIES: TetR/AcrR family transcriptional regulator C-terminal domain-containing protein [Streptomyces]|uniref:TetR/AcrR family transcriptional regulator C-terminal domain-containing protein n=1 Tax=Streptomyces TaxID=1883 RepID=UPI002248DB74|nr:TetR/AcrR family transcriptional regulator C-terminal domain-containing protein [Streptomyces sp. JHD 1]MCX2968360.1 TetR/AcrR family transcriptional regulator C-terminal domain-containing protein [Streptomyces sp. JHD 1]